MKTHHPTRDALVDTVVRLLETHQPQELTLDLVLKESGISHGSLYHHFGAFPNLIDHAIVARFSGYVDRSIELLTEAAVHAQTRDALLASLKFVTERTQGSELKVIRAYRMEALAQGNLRPEFGALLGAEQQRLTDAIADLVRDAQAKGLYRPELDPVVVAVFIQSYTIGRAVDDVTPEHMSQDAWNDLINKIIENVLVVEA
ncbi:MAG: hypothetical protein RL196_538 [Actinomycetota bacterium]|jgi:AcrR family transcriptional regulator